MAAQRDESNEDRMATSEIETSDEVAAWYRVSEVNTSSSVDMAESTS